jgi:hypothetical protein
LKHTQKLQQQPGSLKQLKQQLELASAAKAKAQAAPRADNEDGAACCEHIEGIEASGRDDSGAHALQEGGEAGIPLEQTRVLTQEDFTRIRKLKVCSSPAFRSFLS